ncbi:MAG: hypothetical protein ACOZF0_13235 [Thermodesulfobacteriota bacterium]
MPEKVGKVMVTGLQAEQLAIQHMGQKTQLHAKIIGVGEDLPDAFYGESLLYKVILSREGGIIIIDKFEILHLPVNHQGQKNQKNRWQQNSAFSGPPAS